MPTDKIEFQPADFPGDLREIAEVIGPDATEKLADHFEGCRLYVPKRALSEVRNRKIRHEYNGGNADELARRYSITSRRIYQILQVEPPRN